MSRRDTNYRLPKRVSLNVGVVYLHTYFKADGSKFIGFANDKLWEHNIGMNTFPNGGKKTPANTITYETTDENGNKTDIVPDNTEKYLELYAIAKKRLKKIGCHYSNPLIVVFGQFQMSAYGVAPPIGYLKRMALVAPHATEPGDLLHEIGHAADLDHDKVIKNPRNFMDTYGNRATMYRYQVEAIGKAVFAVG